MLTFPYFDHIVCSGTPAATAPDNCHNSQLGDIACISRDQEGGPGVTTVPSSSASASLDNCRNSQPGDVTGNAGDQGGEPRATTAPGSSATASPDNTIGDARKQRLRLRSTMEMPQPQLQVGPHYTNPRQFRGITLTRGKQLR